jgi:hypothetical protein
MRELGLRQTLGGTSTRLGRLQQQGLRLPKSFFFNAICQSNVSSRRTVNPAVTAFLKYFPPQWKRGTRTAQKSVLSQL